MNIRASILTWGAFFTIAAASCGGDDKSSSSPSAGGASGAAEDDAAANTGGQAGSGGTANTMGGAGGSEAGGTMNTAGSNHPADGGADSNSSDAGLGACVKTDGGLVAPTVPDAIKVPAGATPVAGFSAQGDQVYTCTDTTSDAGDGGASFTWVLKAPDAKLYDADCKEAGAHFAGPTWAAKDGSSVVGVRLSSAPSANAGAIPQLLLKAGSHAEDAGAGVFSNVTFVQRLDTKGGSAPASCAPADVGKELRVAYTASYFFYTGGTTADSSPE